MGTWPTLYIVNILGICQDISNEYLCISIYLPMCVIYGVHMCTYTCMCISMWIYIDMYTQSQLSIEHDMLLFLAGYRACILELTSSYLSIERVLGEGTGSQKQEETLACLLLTVFNKGQHVDWLHPTRMSSGLETTFMHPEQRNLIRQGRNSQVTPLLRG